MAERVAVRDISNEEGNKLLQIVRRGYNCSVESFPNPGGTTLGLHFILLPLFGMPIGEFWELEALADACAEDGRYEFMFASLPVNVTGANGSPCQALAIK
jgi:hypothetical protein